MRSTTISTVPSEAQFGDKHFLELYNKSAGHAIRLMEISIAERNMFCGRFKNCDQELLIKDGLPVVLIHKPHEFEEKINWIAENIQNKWYISSLLINEFHLLIRPPPKMEWIYYFSIKNDATLFKLTWR